MHATSNSRSQGTGGATTGSISVPQSVTGGSYQLVYYLDTKSNGAWIEKARSSAFQIAAQKLEWQKAFDDYVGDGSRFVNATDSGSLAWYQGPIMDGYLTMYEATKDATYIEKAKHNMDIILSREIFPRPQLLWVDRRHQLLYSSYGQETISVLSA